MMRIIILAFAVLVAAGCDQLRGEANFPVSVSNRAAHAIRFYANGNPEADVPAGKVLALDVKLPTLRSYGVVGATEQAQANFSAEDLVTHKLSANKSLLLTQDRPTNVEFTDWDFH